MALVEIPDWEEIEKQQPPGLKYIPILPSDYPLFDWEDWKSSREALVQGTPTKYFAKEAWNAIVDAIYNALQQADLDWQDARFHDLWKEEPYTVEDCKILKPYGQLTAVNFNVVCKNLETATPLRWAWATKPEFRGYIGRPRFYGTRILYDEDGAISKVTYGDNVYPEYILELVRRVNLMLELMRGTALTTEADSQHNSSTLIYHQVARSLPSARIQWSHRFYSNISLAPLDGLNAIVITPQLIAESVTKLAMELLHAGGIAEWINIPTNIQVSGKVHTPDQIQAFTPRELSSTKALVELFANVKTYFSVDHLSHSSTEVELDQSVPIPSSSQVSTESSSSVELAALKSPFRDAHHISKTSSQLEISPVESLPFTAARLSQSRYAVEMYMAIVTPMRMYLEFSLYMEASAQQESVLRLFAHNSPSSVLLKVQPKQESPEDLLLEIPYVGLFTASLRQSLINPYYLYGSDSTLLGARPELEQISDLYLLAEDRVLYWCAAVRDLPKSIQVFLNQFDTYFAAGQPQIPERLYQTLPGIWYYCFGGRLETPRELWGFTTDLSFYRSGVKREHPREVWVNYQFSGFNWGHGRIDDITRAYLNVLGCHLTFLQAESSVDTPRGYLLYVESFQPKIEYVWPRVDEPRLAQLWEHLYCAAEATPDLEEITPNLLRSYNPVGRNGWGLTQPPNDYYGYVKGIYVTFLRAEGLVEIPKTVQMYHDHKIPSRFYPSGTGRPRAQGITLNQAHILERFIKILGSHTQFPSLYWLLGDTHAKSVASSALEIPETILGYSGAILQAWVLKEQLQSPLRNALYDSEDLLLGLTPNLQFPSSNSLSSETSEFLSVSIPSLETPIGTLLATEQEDLGNAVAQTQTSAPIGAYLMEPFTGIARAFAKTTIVIRVYTSGEGFGSLVISLDPKLSSPIPLYLWITQYNGITGFAAGRSMTVLDLEGIAALADIKSCAGHYVLKRILSSGFGWLPEPHLLGQGHTATTVATSGRTIEIEFISEFLCRYSLGRNYHVRMYTSLGSLLGVAFGDLAYTVPSSGVLTLVSPKGTAIGSPEASREILQHSQLGSIQNPFKALLEEDTHRVQAKVDLGRMSSKAGAITWTAPVRKDNTLYIRQVYETERSGNSLKLL